MPPWAPSTVRAQAWERFGRAVLAGALHERRRQASPRCRCRRAGRPARLVSTRGDGGGGAVDQPAARRAAAGVQEHPVPGPVLPVGRPPRAGHGRAGEDAAGGQAGPDAVGQVLGVGVGHDQRRHLLGAVARRCRRRRRRPWPGGSAAGLACSCSQPCSARSCWDRGGVAPAEQVEGLPVGGVDLAAVDRQPGRRDNAGSWRAVSMWSAIPPAPTGWDWRGSPSTHIDPPGQASTAARTASTSRVGVWEISSRTTTVPGRQRPVGQVDAQPGDGAGVQAGAGQLGHRLGRGGHRHHRPAVGRRGLGGGVQHGGLAVTRPGPAPPAGCRPPRPAPSPPPPGPRPSAGAAARAASTADGADGRGGDGRPGRPSGPGCGPPAPGGRPSTTAPAGAGPPPRRGSGAPPGRRRGTGRPWRRSPPARAGRRRGRRCARPHRPW